MVAVKKLAMYLIPIVVLVILVMAFYSDGGLFGNLKSGTNDTLSYLPDVSFGAEEVEPTKPTLPSNHQKAVDKLVKTMKEMKDSGNQNCFGNYGGLPELGEQGTLLQFSQDGDDVVLVAGTEGGIVQAHREVIEDVKLCVIAGTESKMENFHNIFLNDKSWDEKENLIKTNNDYFNPVSNTIQIYYSTKGKNGNIIRIHELGENEGKDGINNFQDAGIIYTPDGEHICFFPTVQGDLTCDGSNDKGLDNDCLGNDLAEDINIRNQLNNGKLNWC